MAYNPTTPFLAAAIIFGIGSLINMGRDDHAMAPARPELVPRYPSMDGLKHAESDPGWQTTTETMVQPHRNQIKTREEFFSAQFE